MNTPDSNAAAWFVDRPVADGRGGALAVIDPTSHKRIADISLAGHPESFQRHPNDDRILLNVPDAHQIAIVSRTANRQTAAWPAGRAALELSADSRRREITRGECLQASSARAGL
jgi:hypothetical protein